MPPPVKSFGERIADAMIEDGLLSVQQVVELLELQKKEGTRLLKLVVEKSFVTDMDLAVSMGRVLNTPPVNLARISIATDIADLVPREVAINHKVLPAYPDSARAAHETGTVVLKVLVAANGTPKQFILFK